VGDGLSLSVELALSGGRIVRARLAPSAPGRIVSSEPVAFSLALASDGVERLVVRDLDAGDAGRPAQLGLAAEIGAVSGCAVRYRGGLASVRDIERASEAGVDQIVLDAAVAFADAAVLRFTVDALGARLVVALDAEGERLRGPAERARFATLAEAGAELAYRGVPELAYTDLARAGTLSGPNLEALGSLCDAVGCAVTYGGGVRTADDISAIAALGRANLRGVTVATALYEGALTAAAAVAAAGGVPERGKEPSA
jgi:phosphoribosylformimino-5-aminoimidazole carboxamide ribotide isomerase